MSTPPKVLFVCHNHPDLHPGGTEIFSHGLFRAMKARHGLEAVYLACVNRVHRGRLPGTLLQSAGRAPDEILLWAGHFDRFTLSQIDLHGIVPEFERLLLAFRPDVVHFHHVLLMGVEAVQVVRRVLPNAAILLTLHDYYPICANDGQMVTTRDRKLCRTASADSCASCFPETQRDQFVMRELFIKQNLSLVDRFISPSDFLKQRYVDWGLPADRIDVVRNGLRDAEPAAHRSLAPNRRRDRFAFFGHLNPFKGALVAIEAAKRLAQRTDGAVSLTLHGSADFQTDDFKAELAKACEGAPFIVARGRYSRDELPALMADADWVIVPSIWWENAPLIIQEAFQHRRPVICSGIGGMAESVRDGIDGLWFHAADPRHLADKMGEALDPDCWTKLVAGINAPRTMSEAADEHLALYKAICAAHRGVEIETTSAIAPPTLDVAPAKALPPNSTPVADVQKPSPIPSAPAIIPDAVAEKSVAPPVLDVAPAKALAPSPAPATDVQQPRPAPSIRVKIPDAVAPKPVESLAIRAASLAAAPAKITPAPAVEMVTESEADTPVDEPFALDDAAALANLAVDPQPEASVVADKADAALDISAPNPVRTLSDAVIASLKSKPPAFVAESAFAAVAAENPSAKSSPPANPQKADVRNAESSAPTNFAAAEDRPPVTEAASEAPAPAVIDKAKSTDEVKFRSGYQLRRMLTGKGA